MTDDATTPITPPEHHRHQTEPPPRSGAKTGLIITIVVLGLGIIALVLFLLFGRGSTPDPTPTPTPTETSASPTPTPTPTEVAACASDTTTLSLGQPDTAAGTTRVPLIFTNGGSAACTVQGFPVVSFVGDDQSTPLGAASTDDTATSPVQLITIEPGNSAESILTITSAGNVCEPVDAAGFAVTLPGASAPVFLASTDYQACDEPNTALLQASAIDTN